MKDDNYNIMQLPNIEEDNINLPIEIINVKNLQINDNTIKNNSNKKDDIINKNLIKGLLDIKFKENTFWALLMKVRFVKSIHPNSKFLISFFIKIFKYYKL